MNQQFQHQRRSIRLEHHDCSSAGAYFATICTETRGINWFGAVSSSDGVQLSPAGEMVRRELERLPQRFTNLEIDEFIVMPDHVHVIFILHDDADTATRRGELHLPPESVNANQPTPSSESALGVCAVKGEHVVRRTHVRKAKRTHGRDARPYAKAQAREREYVHPNGTQADSIGRIMQLFKTFTTQEYTKGVRESGWPPFEKRFWERVIRDDAELEVKRARITGNPARHLKTRGAA